MGMFNTIVAPLTCPLTGRLLPRIEIQIKWQDYGVLALATYAIGDRLDDLEPSYDQTWVKTDFICDACSQHQRGGEGRAYIPTQSQVWHPVYVEVGDAVIRRVLNEAEFAAIGVTDFVNDL